MFWRRLLYLLPWRRRAAERDMQEELRSIAAMAAPGELGNLTLAAEDARAQWGWTRLEHAIRDLRSAGRRLRRSPGFAITAILSLALGIGANAAMFMLVDRVLLRSLPVADSHELVFVFDQRLLTGRIPRFSYPFYALLADNGVLRGTAAHFTLPLNATTNDGVARVRGELVSGSYFGVLGASTQIGRPLTPLEDRTPGSHPVVVISDRFWQRAFGSDPAVLGRPIHVNHQQFTIIGVAEKGFGGTEVITPTDIWLPMMMQKAVGRDLLTETRTNWLEIIGRLEPGQSAEAAAAALTSYVEQRTGAVQTPTSNRFILVAAAKGNSPLVRQLGPALKVLFALSGLALLMACVNVASLLMIQTVGREKEIAVRLALGAGRGTLVRQFLTETIVLAALGGATGFLLAPWTAGLLAASQPGLLDLDLRPDMRVVMFTAAGWLLAVVVVGLAPIIASHKVRLVPGSAETPVTPRAHARAGVHHAVVAIQIALSLFILIGAALFVQSLRNLTTIDAGFRSDNVLLLAVDPRAAGYNAARADTFWRTTLERIGQIPGVESVSFGGLVPLAPGRQRQPMLNPNTGEVSEIDTNFVGPQYFRTLGIPVVRGRDVEAGDSKTSQPVAIVNEQMARLFWPGQDAVGQSVRSGPGKPAIEIVGVVKDAKYRDLREAAGPMLYRPFLQTSSSDPMVVHIRTTNEPETLAGPVRRELQELDANIPLFDLRTLDAQVKMFLAQPRQAAFLTSGFGLIALLLSGIGVYGVTALAVSRQTRDIGIRMALGAQPRHVVAVLGTRGLAIVSAGVTLGLLGAYSFTQIAGTLLFGITARDSATFVSMSAVLAVLSMLAMYVPLRRATRLDVLAAIRRE